jgi:hypothetical protein
MLRALNKRRSTSRSAGRFDTAQIWISIDCMFNQRTHRSIPYFRFGSIPTSESSREKRRVELPLNLEEFTMDEAAVRPHPEP